MNRPALLRTPGLQDSSVQADVEPSVVAASAYASSEAPKTGILIINADDWGLKHEATNRTLECLRHKAVSSVSAMVFMGDSERGAQLALGCAVDAGLHLNLTTPFSAAGVPDALMRHHERVAGYLTRHRLAQVLFHPGLHRSFQYVVSAQLDEFRRLYQRDPNRIDGHHHMHLCANVLLPGLLPEGTIARRNFSFRPGQKSLFNRLYRQGTDSILASRHRVTDFFFSLPPFEPPTRLEQIFSLARRFVVEVETHPVNSDEYRFLAGGELFARTGDLPIAPRFDVPQLRRS
jgi:chitin disaccharide deacetylase